MRNLLYIGLTLTMAAACGCASSSKTETPAQTISNTQAWWPKVLESGSHGQIRSAGEADALADIASGHPRICCTGTIASFPVGVPDKYLNYVKKLPKVPLPSGCTEPLVGVATIYAKAYNTEIVDFLKSNFGAEHRPKITLAELPKIGVPLRDLPETQALELVNSGTLAPSYLAEVKGVEYVIAVSRDTSNLLFVSCRADKFKTPEGFSMDNTIGDLLEKHPDGKRKETGWGSYVLLPSGWAAFEAVDGTHDPKSKICFFFRRERDEKK